MIILLRAASIAPVMAPLVMEFQGSSLPRKRTRPQSMVEKSPPHTAKLPARETEPKPQYIVIHESLICTVQNAKTSHTQQFYTTQDHTKKQYKKLFCNITSNLWCSYSHSICAPS